MFAIVYVCFSRLLTPSVRYLPWNGICKYRFLNSLRVCLSLTFEKFLIHIKGRLHPNPLCDGWLKCPRASFLFFSTFQPREQAQIYQNRTKCCNDTHYTVGADHVPWVACNVTGLVCVFCSDQPWKYRKVLLIASGCRSKWKMSLQDV